MNNKRTLFYSLILIFSLYSASFAQGFQQTQILELKPTLSTQKAMLSQAAVLTVTLKVADSWHINAHKPLEEFLIPTNLELELPDGILTEKIEYPEPHKVKFDFSETPVLVYEGTAQIKAYLEISQNAQLGANKLNGKVSYQGCNNETCLPPDEKKFSVTIQVEDNDTGAPTSRPSTIEETPEETTEFTADEQKAKEIIEKGMGYAIVFFFLAGLALNLTPCVYPVIPITVSFFGAQSKDQKGASLLIALFYVLGIALVFAALGLISGLAGKQWGFLFQDPWFVVIIALILLAMAASMFGAFEIRIPSKLMTALGQSRKGILGALIMGLTVGVVITPCAAGLIIGLVGLVAKLGIVLKGTLLFFIMGLGLGLPYLFLALFSGLAGKLPKSGMWMVWIRKLFGILLIGVAFYFLVPQASRIPDLQSFFFGLISLFGGLFLGFLDHEHGYTKNFKIGRAVFGILLLLLGVFWMNQAIDSIAMASEKVHQTELVKWIHYKNEDLAQLKAGDKPIIMDFYADWCAPCKKMNRTTFVDDAVVNKSKEFTMIKIDCTNPTPPIKELMQKHSIVGMPTLIFLAPGGEENPQLRAVQYVGPDDFLEKMKQIFPLSWSRE